MAVCLQAGALERFGFSSQSRRCAMAVLVLAISGAACASDSESDRDAASEPSESGQKAASDAGVRWEDLPVVGRAYRMPIDEALRNQRLAGIESLEAEVRCLADKGSTDYRHEISAPEVGALLALARARTEDDARERGLRILETFEMRDTGEPISVGDELPSRSGDFDPARMQAFEEAAAACRSEAQQPERPGGVMSSLVDSYRAEVLGDPKVRQAFGRWETCMHDRGYSVSSVQELFHSIQRSTGNDYLTPPDEMQANVQALGPKEVEAALAQLACDNEELAAVVPHWAELETMWQSENAAQFEQLPTGSLDIWPAAVGL